MFRGSAQAKIDDKGRLKLPSQFLGVFNEDGGNRVYITSLDCDYARIYPLAAWMAVEERLLESPASKPILRKFVRRTALYGHETSVDGQGRLLIPRELRDKAGLNADVKVVGANDYLEVWNLSKLEKDVDSEEWGEAQEIELSENGF